MNFFKMVIPFFKLILFSYYCECIIFCIKCFFIVYWEHLADVK